MSDLLETVCSVCDGTGMVECYECEPSGPSRI
jgi:hypothetical protein